MRAGSDGVIWAATTAAEIIELIKRLRPEERAEVMAYLERQPGVQRAEEAAAGYATGERRVSYVSDEEFEKIVPQVLEKHRELFRRLAQ